MILEDIGEDDDALLCITNQTACCRPNVTNTGEVIPGSGNWYFPTLETCSISKTESKQRDEPLEGNLLATVSCKHYINYACLVYQSTFTLQIRHF